VHAWGGKGWPTYDWFWGIQADNGNLSRLFERPNQNNDVVAVGFDRKGHLFAALRVEDDVIIRNMDLSKEINRVGWQDSFGFHYLGSGLALTVDDLHRRELRLWDTTTSVKLPSMVPFPGSGFGTWPTTVTPDGRFIGYYSQSCMYIFEVMTGERRSIPFDQPPWYSTEMREHSFHPGVFSPAGNAIVVRVRLNESSSSEPHWVLNLLARLGINLGRGPESGFGVKLYQIASGEEIAHFSGASYAAFSPDGKTLAVAKANGQIELWDFPLAQPPRYLFIFLAAVTALLTFAAGTFWHLRNSK
jgi:WD40 repeat protein